FFQAEDGIRYRNVTGVQTCALPIFALLCLVFSICIRILFLYVIFILYVWTFFRSFILLVYSISCLSIASTCLIFASIFINIRLCIVVFSIIFFVSLYDDSVSLLSLDLLSSLLLHSDKIKKLDINKKRLSSFSSS